MNRDAFSLLVEINLKGLLKVSYNLGAKSTMMTVPQTAGRFQRMLDYRGVNTSTCQNVSIIHVCVCGSCSHNRSQLLE